MKKAKELKIAVNPSLQCDVKVSTICKIGLRPFASFPWQPKYNM